MGMLLVSSLPLRKRRRRKKHPLQRKMRERPRRRRRRRRRLPSKYFFFLLFFSSPVMLAGDVQPQTESAEEQEYNTQHSTNYFTVLYYCTHSQIHNCNCIFSFHLEIFRF